MSEADAEGVTLPHDAGGEDDADRALRPRRLAEFIGQEHVVEQLEIALAAAQGRSEALDHVLLEGPPGLGKSTLAHIVAAEMEGRLHLISGPALDRKGDLAAILTSLESHDVLFVDEIHRLNRALEELLYPAMEDRAIDIVIGQGPGARTLRLALKPFTLVGATTRASLLSKPLRDRFGCRSGSSTTGRRSSCRSCSAPPASWAWSASPMARSRSPGAAAARPASPTACSGACATTPRSGRRSPDAEVAREALDLIGVDQEGLERLDRELLRTLVVTFGGAPVGLTTLAAALGEDRGTVEDVYEPYLLQKGLIQRTPQGRVATPLGRAHIGQPDAPGDAIRLFG